MTVTVDRSVEEFTAAPRKLFINGEWVEAASGQTFDTPNPATGETLASIAEALQYIAVYHPPSFIRALADSYAREESPAARDAMAQILINSRMAAFGRRPICQDTGVVNVFVKIGMGARIDSELGSSTCTVATALRAAASVELPAIISTWFELIAR